MAAVVPEVEAYLLALEAVSWACPYVRAHLDKAKTLAELQRSVSEPRTGYDIHHIVEQTPARQDGFSESSIEAPENRVRISTLKHWEITAWFSTQNDDYGGLSPRDFLRGKSWDDRVKIGLQGLVRDGVLQP